MLLRSNDPSSVWWLIGGQDLKNYTNIEAFHLAPGDSSEVIGNILQIKLR